LFLLETSNIHHHVQAPDARQNDGEILHHPFWKRWPGQFFRFGFVGVLNTLLDILLLNGLLWLFPTTDTFRVLLFNSIAYSIGAVNSFVLNKYWTFGHRQQTTWGEVRRFTITTLVGIACNDVLIWFANNLFHSLIAHSSLWLNASKVVAIAGTVFVSYLGMRLWVFVKKPQDGVSPSFKGQPKDMGVTLHAPVTRRYRTGLRGARKVTLLPGSQARVGSQFAEFLSEGCAPQKEIAIMSRMSEEKY
jgi:putative flippase GtrA